VANSQNYGSTHTTEILKVQVKAPLITNQDGMASSGQASSPHKSPGLKLKAYSLNAQFISSNFITEDPPAFRIKNFQPISNAGK
jgi:hypothetical protein